MIACKFETLSDIIEHCQDMEDSLTRAGNAIVEELRQFTMAHRFDLANNTKFAKEPRIKKVHATVDRLIAAINQSAGLKSGMEKVTLESTRDAMRLALANERAIMKSPYRTRDVPIGWGE